MHDARGEALRRGAASRRAAAASSAESTVRCIHRASRRQRDAQPQLGRRSVRVEGPSDTKHRLKFSVQRSAQQATWLDPILAPLEKSYPTTAYQNFKRVKNFFTGPNTRFSELDGFSRQPIGTRHFASTTHAARTPRRVPRRAAASEVPRMDPFETPPATQSSVDPFGTPPATPRPAPNAAEFVPV